MPHLTPHPLPFIMTVRYTLERHNTIDCAHSGDFLWPQKHALMHHFIVLHEKAFAWNDTECGQFHSDFFPPVDFPVIMHEPWVQRNIPIPPGIYREVCDVIKRKIDISVYELSNSSYHLQWFCIIKKDGKSLHLIHSLELLNTITIQHSGIPPIPEHLAEQFSSHACSAMLDLYVGYDQQLIAESSCILTTFQTPFGALRLVTLPMRWTNSVPIFHDNVTYILCEEIPYVTIPYIDDVPVKGPASRYQRHDGSYETITANSGI